MFTFVALYNHRRVYIHTLTSLQLVDQPERMIELCERYVMSLNSWLGLYSIILQLLRICDQRESAEREVKDIIKSLEKSYMPLIDSSAMNFKMIDSLYLSSSSYCLVLLTVATIWLLVKSTVQYWKLRKIPGPRLAAWTNLWLMWHMHTKETFHVVKKKLHQKYGPVHRYGPNRVMFSDPAAIPIILGSTNIFPKVCSISH